MSSAHAFRVAFRLGLATTLMTFLLMVLGSVVRGTGSGLACPDWPLCHGRLIPPLQFNVLVEWSHRLLALLVSVCLAITVGWIALHRALRPRLGGLAIAAVGLIVVQIVLGALTVWKLLDPGVVGGHLAVALMFFVTLLLMTLVAATGADQVSAEDRPERPAGLLAVSVLVAVLTFAQAVLGGVVSTHHAGLACPDWPTCLGRWFPPLEGLVGIQMIHRFGAYLLTAAMLAMALRTRLAPDVRVRAGGSLALSLTVMQVVLGVLNVLLGTPWWLSAAHLATAVTLLAVTVTLAFRAARLRSPARRLAAEPAGSLA